MTPFMAASPRPLHVETAFEEEGVEVEVEAEEEMPSSPFLPLTKPFHAITSVVVARSRSMRTGTDATSSRIVLPSLSPMSLSFSSMSFNNACLRATKSEARVNSTNASNSANPFALARSSPSRGSARSINFFTITGVLSHTTPREIAVITTRCSSGAISGFRGTLPVFPLIKRPFTDAQ